MLVFLGSMAAAVFLYCMVVMVGAKFVAGNENLKNRLEAAAALSENNTGYDPEDDSNQIVKAFVNSILNAIAMFIPQNKEAQEELSKQLKRAAVHMDPRRYMARRLMGIIVIAVIIFLLTIILNLNLLYRLAAIPFGLFAGYSITKFSLSSKIKKRDDEMYHQMPEMLDLLSVSVSAGLGFDQALTYVVEKNEGALYDEVDVAQREITMGRPRREALLGLAERCGSMEMRTFVTAVIQADEMGSSMRNVLITQSETIRLTHKQQVEEEAQKLPVKMLVPLVFCIFPVMFIVLMGPAALSIMGMFSSM